MQYFNDQFSEENELRMYNLLKDYQIGLTLDPGYEPGLYIDHLPEDSVNIINLHVKNIRFSYMRWTPYSFALIMQGRIGKTTVLVQDTQHALIPPITQAILDFVEYFDRIENILPREEAQFIKTNIDLFLYFFMKDLPRQMRAVIARDTQKDK